MKKNFIRVAVFCALTATAAPVFVGCSDYDDDINRLQGEIDQINGVIGVSGEEMAAAIQTAIDGLRDELNTAMAGKADAQAVQQLQTTVGQLVDAMEGEDGTIDVNLIKQLQNDIEALKTEVNNTKGALDTQKEDLEGKIEEVNGKIEDLQTQISQSEDASKIAALEEEVGTLTRELATLKTNLDTVLAALDDNGQVITDLAARLKALENFKESVENEEQPTFVDFARFNALTNTVDSLSNELKTLKEKIDGAAQGSEVGGIIERLEALETWKNDGISELLKGYATTESVTTLSDDINKIKKELGLISSGDEGDDVKTSLELIDEQIKALESRVDKLFGNTLQSLVYLPNPDNAMGDTEFSTLWYRTTPTNPNTGVKLAQNAQVKVRFRVTPAAAAKKIVESDDYILTFDGMKQNYTTRATQAGLLNIVSKQLGSDEGVVELTVELNESGYNGKTIGNNSYWALALNVKAKEPVKNEETGETPAKEDYTDIVSNYFITHREDITLSRVQVQHAPISDADLTYNDAQDKVVYGGTGSWLAAWKWDETGTNESPINFTGSNAAPQKVYDFAEKFNCFTTVYKFQSGTDANVFQIDGATGTVTLKNPGSTANIGQQAGVMAETTINGRTEKWTSNFSRKVTVARAALNVTLGANDFVDAQGRAVNLAALPWTKSAQTFYLSTSKLNEIIDMVKLNTGDFFTQVGNQVWNSTDGKATLTSDATNKRFILTIAAGAALGSGNNATTIQATPSVTFAGATQNMQITLTMPQTASYPNAVLQKADAYWSGNVATFVPTYTIVEVTNNNRTYKQVQAVNFTFDMANLFRNFTQSETEIETNRGGVLDLEAAWKNTSHPGAVTINNSSREVTFNKNSYETSYGNVEITAQETYGGHLSNDLSGALAIANISGTMTQGKTAIEVSDLRETYHAFTGWSWADINGLTMWSEGSTNVESYLGNGLDMNGLAAPTLEFADANDPNNDYITIDNATAGTFSVKNKDLILVNDVVVRLRVKASSRWGAISGYDANNVITVTLKAGA